MKAYVIGSGPNGLAAAITLARAGLAVDVYEAEEVPGGACRTLPFDETGCVYDFGSAVHPLAAGSPFFRSLSLERYGLEWIPGDAPLVHPFDDGSAAVLEQDLDRAERELGQDGRSWRRLMRPAAEHWEHFAGDALGPVIHVPKHPLLMARFGLAAVQSARALAFERFATGRARALFAGIAAHSFLSLDAPMSASAGMLLGTAAHAVGWPIPRGGAGSLTKALLAHFGELGGRVFTGRRVDVDMFQAMRGEDALVVCDLSPGALMALAGDALRPGYQSALKKFKHAPGAFKVDYVLSEPVPWRAPECRRAVTVHLGGSFSEIAAAEERVTRGHVAERPFVLTAQPSLFDSTRAPQGKHVLWAYCHVPNGSTIDVRARMEEQIERFAPGFRDCILARRVSSPSVLEGMDANLEGGDISGGAYSISQFLFRPTIREYGTPAGNVYLCSASTPPGGGVHGMCGYHAARRALMNLLLDKA